MLVWSGASHATGLHSELAEHPPRSSLKHWLSKVSLLVRLKESVSTQFHGDGAGSDVMLAADVLDRLMLVDGIQ